MIPLLSALEVKQIKNPILPVSLGKAYISNSQYISMYHINISSLELCIEQSKYLLSKLNLTISNEYNKNDFMYMTQSKLNQTFDYLKLIEQNTLILYRHKIRNKRGLINIVGKVNKWLFGTMDSDDEERYDSYLKTINQNQQNINNDFRNEQTILKEVIDSYDKQMTIITNNQNTILTKLNIIEKQTLDISHALYLSLILDNIIIQVNKINHLVNNIENAISFAQANIMHNTILSPKQLNDLIIKTQQIYGKNNIISLQEEINYYKLFSAQVFIKNKIIIFSVHIPIVNPDLFLLYKVYPIPIQNLTIILPKPYVLITEGTQWTSQKLCPNIEDIFICQQESLSKEELCAAKLLMTNKNECPVTSVHYVQTSIEKIHGEEILIIPAEEIIIETNCRRSIIRIKEPSIIQLPECPLEINGKFFEKDRKTNLQYVLELPEIEMPIRETKTTHMELQKVNFKEIENARTALENMKFANLNQLSKAKPYWIIAVPVAIFIILIIAILFLTVPVWKETCLGCLKCRRKKTQKIQEPVFSELEEGGVM